jgi:hypothetical protein
MNEFISLLAKSLKNLGNSPVLWIVGFIVGALSLPLLAQYAGLDDTMKSIAIDFSQLVLPILIMPFLAGGALGYALEVRKDGSSSLKTFLASATKNYPKMLMGGILAFCIYYFLVTGIMVFLLAGSLFDPFLGSIMGILMVGLTFLCLTAIEFYDISIVAENTGVMAAFKNSIDFARKNLGMVVVFFLLAVFLKAMVQAPLSVGLAGAMMTNQTYYDALMNYTLNATSAANVTAANVTAANITALNATATNATALNSTAYNMTSLFTMSPPPMGPGLLGAVGLFQMVVQGFVFALLALFKADFYLSVRQKKKITDFDYDFSSEEKSP